MLNSMDGQKGKVCFVVIGTMLLASVYCGNILVFPVDGSHWINMKILIEALHERGHNVTVIRTIDSWYIEETSPHYSSVTVPKPGSFEKEFIKHFVNRLLEILRERSTWARLKLEMEMWYKTTEFTEKEKEMVISIIQDKQLMQSLKDTKYDVFLTDPALIGGVIIGHYLKLPLIFNVRWTVQGEGHFAIAPSPLSYVPMPMLELSDKMSFSERILNVIMYFVSTLQIHFFLDSPYNELCTEIFGPGVDYFEIIQGADLWLFRADFIFEFPRPTMPNVVYMGGFQCKPSKPLSEDLEVFVQSSGKHGVIIMSLGTLIEQLPIDVAEAIAEAFAELPQKVIWRYNGVRPSTLGNNTLIKEWIPQNDLLGHPKTRAFVSHGGTNGIQEAIYHGIPIVGLGLIWDQPDNLAKMRVKGVARTVDFATLDKDSFLQALKEVLYEPSYWETMQRLSRLHKDVPVKPLDNAVFWVEYAMRHGGTPHLRTESYKMPWYTYHCVDIIVFLLAVVAMTIIFVCAIIRYICKACKRRKNN